MRKLCVLGLWAVPLAVHSGDALAWGLYTHVYFAQLLIWAMPLADPCFRRAVRRFPDLLLAGACLPDIALFSRWAGSQALGTTHQWSAARRMLAGAGDDESRALAAGYASHLLVDVIAHNHFVPAHERLWFDYPVVTHAACEWAMDAHVGPQLFALPGDLLRHHRARLARHATRFVGCTERSAARALCWLGNGERFLRATGVPALARRSAGALDAAMARRFDHYASETAWRLRQIDRVIGGESPAWNAEPERRERWQPTAAPAPGLAFPQDLF